jgi:pimeloyl-ACP methyl ester carboxylesterase
MSQAEIEHAAVGEIEIAYERFGDPDDPPVLLVMGLATQMLGWPDEFCAGLAAQGHFVVRFDNRDIGLSTHLHDAPPADLMAAFGGDTPRRRTPCRTWRATRSGSWMPSASTASISSEPPWAG